MRGLLVGSLVLASACGDTEDMTKGGDSAGMTEGSGSGSATESASGTEAGSGTEGASEGGTMGMTSTTPTEAGSGEVPECSGDYLCSGATAEACDADPCCRAIEGNIYQQIGDDWCLRPTPEYVGCGHILNDTCDYTGALKCSTTEGLEIQAELVDSCFPHFCVVATPPASIGPCRG